MLERIVAVTTLVSLCLLIVLLNLTAPTTVGPFGILAVFIFSYLSSLGVMTYLLYGSSWLIAHLSSAFTVRKPLTTMSFRNAYYYSTVVALAPVMLIGLRSVGSIGVYEVVLVAIFTAVGCVYITKRIR